MGSQRKDHFVNLERRRDRDVSMHTTCTSGNQSRIASHLSHEEDTKALQLEIDHLKRKLRHQWQKIFSSIFDSSIDDKKDRSYKRKLRTPPSESFSYDEDVHHECRNKSSSSKGLGNDAMSKTLNQISKSPFSCKIEGGRLPRRFTQPVFTMCNGQTDLAEHVSHFN